MTVMTPGFRIRCANSWAVEQLWASQAEPWSELMMHVSALFELLKRETPAAAKL